MVLDAGPLGVVSNPKDTAETAGWRTWLKDLTVNGVDIVVPAIADFEVRRELVRAGKTRGIRYLNRVVADSHYAELTDIALKLAAEFWATARRRGVQTADDKALDADVILAAQAATLGVPTSEYVVATSTRRISRGSCRRSGGKR